MDTNSTTTPMFKSPDELADVIPYYEESSAVDQAVHKALALIEQFASSSSSAGDDSDDNPWKNPDRIYQQLDQARNEISQAWETLHAATRIEYDPLFDDAAGDVAEQSSTAPAEEDYEGAATTTTSSSTTTTTTTATANTTTTATPKQKVVPLSDEKDHAKKEQEQIIRMAYMDMITDAFADVLEDLRQRQESGNKEDPIDVETLVDCLQSGLDLLVGNNRRSSFSETDFEFGGDTRSEDGPAAGAGDDDNKSDDDVKLTPHESRRRQLGYLLVDQL